MNLRKFRRWVEHACIHYDLIKGIQATCKGRFKRFPDYQIRLIYEAFRRSAKPSVILGGREVSKTWAIALGFFLRCITTPDYEVYMVPGQKIDQAKAALKYVQQWTKHSSVVRPMSGLNRATGIEWSTLNKHFTNGSLMMALAPNEGVVSEHGTVWCDEYQFLPDEVDNALQGFTGRVGDRVVYSGTANLRGSPLHRVYQVAQRHYPDHIVTVPVQLAINAGILSHENIEAKRIENGGKLDPVQFDAWFNCVFPDMGTLGWHPLESTLTTQDLVGTREFVAAGTGCDPGLPVNRFVVGILCNNGDVHMVDEFELSDQAIGDIPRRSLGAVMVEHGKAFGGGYNAPFHSLLDFHGIYHGDSFVDGEERDRLLAEAFRLQSENHLFVNPRRCPNLWRACEEQTFDDRDEMDRLPLTHWIYAMMHAVRACATRPLVPTHYQPVPKWV